MTIEKSLPNMVMVCVDGVENGMFQFGKLAILAPV